MKGFIEVTEKHDRVKMLFPVSRISCVFESDDGGAFIETGVDKRGESTGVYVEEAFYAVAQKVAAAVQQTFLTVDKNVPNVFKGE